MGAWGQVPPPRLGQSHQLCSACRAGHRLHAQQEQREGKGETPKHQNICSLPCPKCRWRLRGDSAAQLQDFYSKLSHPPSSISNRISGTYFRRRHFKFRCLNLELHPSLSIPCRRNNCFLLVRLFSQSL